MVRSLQSAVSRPCFILTRCKYIWHRVMHQSIPPALKYFVFEGNFPSTSPRGAYIWRGNLKEGFLPYQFGGAYIWRGLFSEFYDSSIFTSHLNSVSQVCLSAQTSVIIGMMPARLIRSVWRMFLKTITSLFIRKISVLQTNHVKLMKQCMAMEKTFVRRCGQVPIVTPRQMLIILTV